MNIANSWTGVGRFTKDHEVRYGGADNQTAFLKNSIAIDRMTGKDKPKVTDFINVTFAGKMAETVAKYTGKGSLIMVEGEIRTGSYKDRDNKTVYTTDVNVNNFKFMESKRESATPDTIGAPITSDGFVNVAENIEEELPFS